MLGGVYLGWIELSAKNAKRFFAFQKILGTLAVVFGLFLMMTPQGGVVWETYRSGILEEAKASAQPVILDFYADWCIPCHELDQFTYSDPRVSQALVRFRKIKVNATFMDADEIRRLIDRFHVYGVPTIVFLDAEGREVESLRMNGFVPPDEFIEYLRTSRLKPFLETPPALPETSHS